jgi:hypothetical protein
MRILFLLTAVVFCSNSQAQFISKITSRYRSQVAIGHAGIAMPPALLNGRLQPTFRVSIIKDKAKPRYANQEFAVGYMAQRALQRAGYVSVGYGYEWKKWNRVFLRPALNASLLFVQNTNPEFEFRDGEYVHLSGSRLQFMPSFSLDVGTSFIRIKNKQGGLFLRYEFGTQLPFSNLSTILPLSQLTVGFFIKPNQTTKR